MVYTGQKRCFAVTVSDAISPEVVQENTGFYNNISKNLRKLLTSIDFLGILITMRVNKKNVTIKLHPAMIRDIETASTKTGLKKNTIIEQGIETRLQELREKSK